MNEMNETTILILLTICAIVAISTLAVLLYFARKLQLQNRWIFTKLDSAETKLDSAETKLDSAETKLDSAETKLDSAETKLIDTGTKVERINNQQSGIENRLYQNQEKMENKLRDQTRKLNKLKLLNSMQCIEINSVVKSLDSILYKSKGKHDLKERSTLDIAMKLSHKKSATILVAGMRHSGSTALFNCLRYLLLENDIEIESGYSEYDHFPELDIRSNKVRLIKTHEYRDDVALAADFTFTTKRDLRESVASAVRRDFPILKQVGGIVNYAKYNKNMHVNWASTSDFEMVYEAYKTDELSMTLKICQALGFENIDIHALCTKVNNTPKDQYNETLLSESHITNPDGKFSYRDNLSHDDIHIIECQNVTWLEKNGYLDASDL